MKMNERVVKYLIVVGLCLMVFFVFGLVGNILETINNYIKQHSLVFSILVIGAVLLYLKVNKLPDKSESIANQNTLVKLLEQLKLRLGEQYENFEFTLDSVDTKRINGLDYEVYKYNDKHLNKLFDVEIGRGVYLLFNADVLSAVFYKFYGNQFYTLLESINAYLPANNKMAVKKQDDQPIATCKINDDTFLELLVRKDGNTGLGIMSSNFRSNLDKKRHTNRHT